MANTVLKQEATSRSGKRRVYVVSRDNSVTESNKHFKVSYPKISDAEALRIANGMHPSDSATRPEKKHKAPEKPANDGIVFESHEESAPILFEPTKKELKGKNYRGVRMYRRGSRDRKNENFH